MMKFVSSEEERLGDSNAVYEQPSLTISDKQFLAIVPIRSYQSKGLYLYAQENLQRYGIDRLTLKHY